MDIKGGRIVKRGAGFTFIAGLDIFRNIFAVDGLGQDPGACGFPDPPRPTKQKGLGQVLIADGILQSVGNRRLPHNSIKSLWPVFSCRNNKVLHQVNIGIINSNISLQNYKLFGQVMDFIDGC